MYAIYDMKYKEQCIGVFEKIKDIAEYFNTSQETIRSTISRKAKRKGRYLVEKV